MSRIWPDPHSKWLPPLLSKARSLCVSPTGLTPGKEAGSHHSVLHRFGKGDPGIGRAPGSRFQAGDRVDIRRKKGHRSSSLVLASPPANLRARGPISLAANQASLMRVPCWTQFSAGHETAFFQSGQDNRKAMKNLNKCRLSRVNPMSVLVQTKCWCAVPKINSKPKSRQDSK